MKKVWMIFLFPIIIAMACNFPTAGTTSATQTASGVEATIMALAVSGTQTAMASQLQPSIAVPTATPEVFPTVMIPTNLPTQNFTPTPTKLVKPCNAAAYVADLNYEDGTKVPAGTVFTKKWRLNNVGTCTWDGSYQLIFSNGDRMNAPDAVDLNGINIAPGMNLDVAVQLKAPADPGTYRANFMLKSGDGVIFGIGVNAAEVFWAEIKVPSPTDEPVAKADIYITEYTICAAKADVPCEIKVSVYNKGTKVTGPYQVAFYQSDSAPAGCTWNSNNNPGGGEVLSCMYTFPSPYSNIKTRVVVDVGNVVPESDEGNNVKYKTIDVAP